MQTALCMNVLPQQRVVTRPASSRSMRVIVRAEGKAEAAAPKEEKPWSPPTLDPNTPSPIFGGSTGACCVCMRAREIMADDGWPARLW